MSIPFKDDITLIIDNLGSGGAQRQLVLLATELSGMGFNVTLVTYNENNHMDYMLHGLSVRRVEINTNGASKLYKIIKVAHYLIKAKPKVVISYLDNPNIMAGLYSLLSSNVKWIPSERNLNAGTGLQVLWRRFIYKSALKVVSNSYAQQEWILKNKIIPKYKSSVIWNGIFNDFWEPLDKKAEKTLQFLSLGRLSHQKNPELLFEAVKLVNVNGKLNFSWYGDDDPDSPGKRYILKELAKEQCLPIEIFLSSKKPHKLLANAECLILTSRYEGTPNVVLEAMASGVFVIAPKIVDLPIILGDNERGFLFEPQCPQSLANAIRSYLDLDSDLKGNIIKSSLVYAKKNFDSGNLAKKYMDIINYE